jgi:hypothetical protein
MKADYQRRRCVGRFAEQRGHLFGMDMTLQILLANIYFEIWFKHTDCVRRSWNATSPAKHGFHDSDPGFRIICFPVKAQFSALKVEISEYIVNVLPATSPHPPSFNIAFPGVCDAVEPACFRLVFATSWRCRVCPSLGEHGAMNSLLREREVGRILVTWHKSHGNTRQDLC